MTADFSMVRCYPTTFAILGQIVREPFSLDRRSILPNNEPLAPARSMTGPADPPVVLRYDSDKFIVLAADYDG